MATSKSAWTDFERKVARQDWGSERMPLSGMNSRHGGGDVIIPADMDVLVECKYRALHAHHTLLKDAQIDAAKHGKKFAILYTKTKYAEGWVVTLDGSLWHDIISLPQVQELLKTKEKE